MNKLTDLINSYWHFFHGVEIYACALGTYLVELVKPVIPDIRFAFSPYDFEYDTESIPIHFRSESHDQIPSADTNVELNDILEEELGVELNCCYGVTLKQDEAEKIRKIIRKAENE